MRNIRLALQEEMVLLEIYISYVEQNVHMN
jgi:hypothetical protein